MKRGIGWALAAALAASCAAGCKGPPPDKEAFNNLLASYNRKLARPARAFRAAVAPMEKGQPADSSAARNALSDIRKALKEVRNEVNWLDVPTGSGKAPAFLDKYKEYLTMEETLPDKYFQPILDKVDEVGPTPEEKWPDIEALFKQMAHEEKKFIPYFAARGFGNSKSGRPGGAGGSGPGGPPGGPPGGFPGGGAGDDDVPDDPTFVTLLSAQNDYCSENHLQATPTAQVKPPEKK